MSAISQGQVNFGIDNVCQGIKLTKVVIAFVKGQSVAGGGGFPFITLEFSRIQFDRHSCVRG